jgi:hypothetical protein
MEILSRVGGFVFSESWLTGLVFGTSERPRSYKAELKRGRRYTKSFKMYKGGIPLSFNKSSGMRAYVTLCVTEHRIAMELQGFCVYRSLLRIV